MRASNRELTLLSKAEQAALYGVTREFGNYCTLRRNELHA